MWLTATPVIAAGVVTVALASGTCAAIGVPAHGSFAQAVSIVAIVCLISPSLAWLRRRIRRREQQGLVDSIDQLHAELAGDRSHLKQLRFENHWLADIGRQPNRLSAIQSVVRHLSQGATDGFVVAMELGPTTRGSVLSARGLSDVSRRQIGAQEAVVAELRQGSVRLEGRVLRQGALFQCLAPADRRRIRQSIHVFAVGPENEAAWAVATTCLPPVTGSDAEKAAFVQLVCAAASGKRASETTGVGSSHECRSRPASFASPHAELKSIVAELRDVLVADRVALRLLGRDGRIAERAVASAVRMSPPGIDLVWREHEAALCSHLLGCDSPATFRAAELRPLGLSMLIQAAAGAPIRLRSETIGAICCTSQSVPPAGIDSRAILSQAAARIEQVLEQLVPSREPLTFDAANSASDTPLASTRVASPELRDAVRTAEREHFASVTHELRTPMLGILGMTDLMLETELEPQQRQYLAAVRSSSESLLHLVNDLLDLSKLDANSVEIESVSFELRTLLEETMLPLRCRADQKGLLLTLDVHDSVAREWQGDPLRLRQVLNNLVGNAIKFTERGRVTVQVEQESDAGRTLLRCRVIDTGMGIPADRRQRIFDRYAQADATVARQFGGTGLGLSISRRLVELMGGELEVDSEVGRGSVFSFRVEFTPLIPNVAPLRIDAEDANHPRADAPIAAISRLDRAEEGTGSLRVLLVEDHEINQALGVARLEAAGHRVVVARNGREAIARFAEGRFDVVLMDIQMPIVDGLAATAEIRRREAGAFRTPIFGMTACAGVEERARCLAAGMEECLSKPVDVERIESLLSARAAAESGAAETTAFEIPPHALPLARTFLPMFLESSELLCREMRQAASDHDAAAVSAAAHRMNGAASSMSIASISHIAREIERLSGLRKLDAIGPLVDQVQFRLDQIRHQHRSELTSTPDGERTIAPGAPGTPALRRPGQSASSDGRSGPSRNLETREQLAGV